MLNTYKIFNQPRFILTIGSHFFTVTRHTPDVAKVCFHLAYRYTHIDRFKSERVSRKENTFAACTKDDSEFRFHIGQLDTFFTFLKQHGIPNEAYEIVKHPDNDGQATDFNLTPCKTPRTYQNEAVDFVLDGITQTHSRLITAGPGTGKTMMAAMTASRMKTRLGVVVLPKYQKKWVYDLQELLRLDEKQIRCLDDGTVSLKAAIKDAKKAKFKDAYVFSLDTLILFYKSYEDSPEHTCSAEGYGVHPDKLFDLLGIGMVVVDEAHEHLYAVFQVMLYCHTKLLLALSGTFIDNGDPFIGKIQKTMFPNEWRYQEIKVEKYIDFYSIIYRFEDLKKLHIRDSERGRQTYSQAAYERSIIKSAKKNVVKTFLELMVYFVRYSYLQDKKHGDKLALYFFRTETCDLVCKELRKHFPQLDIRVYYQGCDYEDVIKPDIRITTAMSAGTAVDIPLLTRVMNFICMDSDRANIQLLLRLRKIENRDVAHFSFWCDQIAKHAKFQKRKIQVIQNMVRRVKELMAPLNITG